MSEARINLYGTPLSGHVHRVILLLRMLEIPYNFVNAPVEVRRSAEFLKRNPLGQIPVLEDGPIVLADSAAILVYLAKRYAPKSTWLPDEPVAAALVQRWLSIAAGELAHGPATARMISQWNYSADHTRAAQIATRAFQFMNEHLAHRTYLATEHPTIADLACYSYTSHAPEGGVSLEPYAALRNWLSRIEALPRFEPMPRSPIPAQVA